MISTIYQYLPSIISISGLVMIALISPGPDFAITVRNSLIYSRKTALLTALGISLGILIHVSYTILGLGLVIKNQTWLFLLIKYLGASYLIYIGYKGLKARTTKLALENKSHIEDISSLSAIRSGFLTCILNPKAMLFFISLFSVVVAPNTPLFIMLICGVIIFVETLIWFSFVAVCLSGTHTRKKFNAVAHLIERITGGVLILLGLKLLFSEI